MGTNFYHHTDTSNRCPHCDRYDSGDVTHIGKSSCGWCFALHVTDEIRSLDDWQREWAKGGRIVDEYGAELTPDEMLDRIMNRDGLPFTPSEMPFGYPSEIVAMKRNHAKPGPRNLWRHASRNCVGHGDGTWDLIEGEFL